jgi:flavin reductase (DIM6/NTAB) family NADH-FMN oxidoreductase RutF
MSEAQGSPARQGHADEQPEELVHPPVPPGSLSPEEFKAAFRDHAAGVCVVTADDGTGPVGLTATSVFSVSADPPLLVFSLSSSASSAPTLTRAKTAVVHILAADQVGIAKLCATSGIDRFADTSLWTRLRTGEPLFHDAHTWIRGRIVERLRAGTSTVIVLQALESNVAERDEAGTPQSTPLVYHNRTWHQLDVGSRLKA